MKRSVVLFLLSFVIVFVYSQERIVYSINDAWRFTKGSPYNAHLSVCDDSGWDIVNIPHTWNNKDTDDDEPGYYRGPAWYRKKVFIDELKKDQNVVVYFEGANQETKLYVNGYYVGEHKGGYTRFCFDVTSKIRFGEENLFSIYVSNEHNPNIPPLSADFTFYGGIYRDVYLKFINPLHIAVNDNASSGVYINTPKVSEKLATVNVKSLVTNVTKENKKINVRNVFVDADGNEVKSVVSTLKINSGETKTVLAEGIKIENPRLWDIDDPHIYTVYTRIYDEKDNLIDEVINPLGIRWFEFDSEKGFFLNGVHRKLIGTARHQDYFERGNALRDEMHVRDVLLLKEMGGNFLRVSHYPQDPVIMDMCDRLGIVTSVEIPVVNAVTETDEFLNNSVNMAVEMVRQDYNHPSVMIWGYMNEILLRRPYKEGPDLERYYKFTEKVALALENTIRREDQSRYTMMAYHNAPSAYEAAHLTEIPMIQGWNLYQGWYEPDINEFQRLLDRAHDVYKGKCLIVSEYGPGVDPRLHSYDTERFDFSQEYGLVYHSHYMREMMKRPFISGASMWNLNDFYSESRIDAVPHVNNKGVVGLNREKKDTYLFYQTALSKVPFLMIGQREWMARGGVVNSTEQSCMQKMPVFSNSQQVELIVNGKSIGKKETSDYMAIFEVPFVNGVNTIEAIAEKEGTVLRDMLKVRFDLIPYELNRKDVPFTEMNVMLGSPRYFDDRVSNTSWIPEKKYEKGSWGYIGGEPFRRKTSFGTMLGSDIDVWGTDMNPIFQTQRRNIEAFKADVPDGEYTIYLYWAELDSDTKKEALAYNLGADALQGNVEERIFDISINGNMVLNSFNIVREYGRARAVIKKFVVIAKDGNGLTLNFHKQKGEPVLNAIKIHKNR